MTRAFGYLVGPTLMTAVMLAVLIALGTWQVHRLHWKQDLLAQIDRAEAAPSIPLPAAPAPFTRMSATGVFQYDRTALYGAEVRATAAGMAMGARMVVPLRRTTGETLLVDRGWAPLIRTGPLNQPGGIVTVEGYARFGDSPGWFSAKDDLPSRRFYTLNPAAIGQALGQTSVPPFVLVALAAEGGPKSWPDPARHLPRPSNRHLSYAITWYGLALALLAIFAVWAKKGRAHEEF